MKQFSSFLMLIIVFSVLLISEPSYAEDSIREEYQNVGLVSDFSIGAGGHFVRSDNSPVMLFGAALGYRFLDSFEIRADYELLSNFVSDTTSTLHSAGFEFRWYYLLGAYAGAGAGIGWSYLKKDDFQQSKIGYAWLVKLGYLYEFSNNFGIFADLRVNQRFINQLFTDLGFTIGPFIHL